MTEPVFVDSNVLVYARDTSQPAKQSLAADLLRQLWRERTGRLSMQVLSEYYVTVTRKLRPGLNPADAWHDVEAFLSWSPQVIDRPLLMRARQFELRYSLSWWDSLIVSAAEGQNCAVLLSEDMQHGASYGSVTVRNPFKSGVSEPLSHYVLETAVPRHRRPGRPTKARAVAARR